MANAQLLQRTLEHIKANPEQWDQMRCSACFFGWTVRLNAPNVTMLTKESDCGPDCCPSYPVLVDDAGAFIDVRSEGHTLLELTEVESDTLYSGDNTLADLERIVAELTAKEAVSA
ncbi:hypothetical protein AS594_07000 [Streptomyces agglomeratus]|uniref:Uncharacterized protein n=1 Tax=Streptomyces agglomeratus TaxID=285458 RepID=A0A1E5P410_9ACTN|nr:hypothetical protein [Streptomyces agglomeratus]OEJ24269.1 hypothetical protein AS594_07000 [Streptomyces agglomeratus]